MATKPLKPSDEAEVKKALNAILRHHDHPEDAQDLDVQAITAIIEKAVIDELKDFKGWIERIHYLPVNDSDRWCLAAGEIIAEADNRLATLQQQREGKS